MSNAEIIIAAAILLLAAAGMEYGQRWWRGRKK